MQPDFLQKVSKRKPKIMIVNETFQDQVFYATSEAHTCEILRTMGFPTNNKQIATALNPSIKQRGYITRHSDICATITLEGQGWRISRLGGIHKDRMITEKQGN
jgi:hypothetical protein